MNIFKLKLKKYKELDFQFKPVVGLKHWIDYIFLFSFKEYYFYFPLSEYSYDFFKEKILNINIRNAPDFYDKMDYIILSAVAFEKHQKILFFINFFDPTDFEMYSNNKIPVALTKILQKILSNDYFINTLKFIFSKQNKKNIKEEIKMEKNKINELFNSKKLNLSLLNPQEYERLNSIQSQKGELYDVFVPYSWEASKILASRKIGSSKCKISIADKKDPDYWMKNTINWVIFYLIGKNDKYVLYIDPKTKKINLLNSKNKFLKYFKIFKRNDIEVLLNFATKNYNKIKEKYKLFINKIEFRKKQNPKECFYVALKTGYVKKLEDCVIEYDKNGLICFYFARDVKGADIKRLEDAVIEKDIDGHYCYTFALQVKGANIKRLEDAVVKKDKKGKWCYMFARDIKGANIHRLENEVLDKDKTGQYVFAFIEKVKGADKERLKDELKNKGFISKVTTTFYDLIKSKK